MKFNERQGRTKKNTKGDQAPSAQASLTLSPRTSNGNPECYASPATAYLY